MAEHHVVTAGGEAEIKHNGAHFPWYADWARAVRTERPAARERREVKRTRLAGRAECGLAGKRKAGLDNVFECWPARGGVRVGFPGVGR